MWLSSVVVMLFAELAHSAPVPVQSHAQPADAQPKASQAADGDAQPWNPQAPPIGPVDWAAAGATFFGDARPAGAPMNVAVVTGSTVSLAELTASAEAAATRRILGECGTAAVPCADLREHLLTLVDVSDADRTDYGWGMTLESARQLAEPREIPVDVTGLAGVR